MWSDNAGVFQSSKHDNISYNNDVIITMLWHIENPGLVRTVYWGIFTDIQHNLAMPRHTEEYSVHGAIIR